MSLKRNSTITDCFFKQLDQITTKEPNMSKKLKIKMPEVSRLPPHIISLHSEIQLFDQKDFMERKNQIEAKFRTYKKLIEKKIEENCKGN